MPKYRKKPVVIEAVQFDGENRREVLSFAYPHMGEVGLNGAEIMKLPVLIETPKGDVTLSKSDYVTKDITGELYVWAPDIFEKTFNIIDEKETGATITVKDIENGELDVRIDFNPPLEANHENATTAQNAAMYMVNQLKDTCE